MTSKQELDARGRRRVYGGVAALLALFVAAQWLQGNNAKRTQCAETPARSSVILLDYSDSVATQTRDEILARATAWISDSVKEGEMVSIFTVDNSASRNLVPRFSRCKPPREGNELYQNTKKIEKDFTELFSQPLNEILSTSPGRSDESPIAQTIIDLSLSRFLSAADTNALLVFSDMLENTESFSLYKCSSPESAVAEFRSSRQGALPRPSYENLRVSLHLVPRLGTPQTTVQCRDHFWQWFFGDNSGASASVEQRYLPGGRS